MCPSWGRAGCPGGAWLGRPVFLSVPLIPYLFSGVGEDRACSAGIGGEPVEVFVGEGLG
jgi:hypothetical protein